MLLNTRTKTRLEINATQQKNSTKTWSESLKYFRVSTFRSDEVTCRSEPAVRLWFDATGQHRTSLDTTGRHTVFLKTICGSRDFVYYKLCEQQNAVNWYKSSSKITTTQAKLQTPWRCRSFSSSANAHAHTWSLPLVYSFPSIRTSFRREWRHGCF